MKFDFPQKHSHEIVLFFYPSPGLDWSSPRSLTWSTIKNKFSGRPRSIGHVTVMLRTPEEGDLLTGMTQANQNEGQSEVLFQGYGLGILLHNFAGALEQKERLVPELSKRSSKDKMLSYLRISTSGETAKRVLQYLTEYEANGYHSYYGMRNRPRHGEGGGCGPFAASVLEVAGLLTDEITRDWTRTVQFHHDLIGGPITGKKVSLWDVFKRADRWAHDHEPHEKGQFWDPDLMNAWLLKKRENANSPEISPETWNRAIGIHWDAKSVPTPTGPIFLHEE